MAVAEHELPMRERLRLNAEDICKHLGSGWRDEAATQMRCLVDDVGAGPVSRQRDSDALDESNFRVILDDLRSIDERVSVERFRHWGFGWCEEIVVPLDNPAIVHRVEGWLAMLEDYPVADDIDYAELEAEQDADRYRNDEADGLDELPPEDGDGPAPASSSAAQQLRRHLNTFGASDATEPPAL